MQKEKMFYAIAITWC